MIALDIQVKNEWNSYLLKIFKEIDLLNYDFEIISDDILYKENGDIKQGLFGSDWLTGQEFFNYISKEQYYLIFTDIKAYPSNKEHTEINTFEDFLKSNCIIVFLCVDSSFIEVYCKDRYLLETIYNNCVGDDFEKVEFRSISDVSGRTLVAW